jgi:hypothetical protein
MRWRVQGSWAHLEAWGLTTYTAVEIDVRCQDLIKLLRERAELFFRYAHILEATAAWLEEADRQAANDFQSLRDS